MVCKGNWVCFKCRVAARRNTWRLITHVHPETIGMEGDVKCQICSGLMRLLGPSIKVPPKKKTKEWSELEQKITNLHNNLAAKSYKNKTSRKHELEKIIENLKEKPENNERNKLIIEYQDEFNKIT